MSCKKIKNILTKRDLIRIKEIYKKQLPKILKNQDVALYNEDFLDATCCDYHKWILKYLKYYKKPIDKVIKNKIKNAINECNFDLSKFENNLNKKFYKYKKKDWKIFFNRAEYFFELHKGLGKSFFKKNKFSYLDRVYLSCGFEFLLKALFLKKGYLINKAISGNKFQKFNINIPQHPIKLGQLNKQYLQSKINDFNYFIDQLKKIKPSNIEEKYFDYYILAGLKIAQSWRNQDIHTPTGYRQTNGEYQNLLKSSHDNLYIIFFPKEKISKLVWY